MMYRLQGRFQFTNKTLEQKVKVTYIKPVYGLNFHSLAEVGFILVI